MHDTRPQLKVYRIRAKELDGLDAAEFGKLEAKGWIGCR